MTFLSLGSNRMTLLCSALLWSGLVCLVREDRKTNLDGARTRSRTAGERGEDKLPALHMLDAAHDRTSALCLCSVHGVGARDIWSVGAQCTALHCSLCTHRIISSKTLTNY